MAQVIQTEREPISERRSTGMGQINMGMFGRRVSWAAVFAGIVVTTFVQILLSSLGAAIGANVAGAQDGVAQGIGIGAGIWLFISSIVALFTGGWVAGRLSGIPRKTEGMLHGFLTASAGTVFVLYLMTTAIGGVFGSLSNVIGGSLQGVGGNEAITQQLSAVADDLQARVQDVSPGAVAQQANQVEDQAAQGVATAGYAAFMLLLLSCGAAIWGGYVSAPKETRPNSFSS